MLGHSGGNQFAGAVVVDTGKRLMNANDAARFVLTNNFFKGTIFRLSENRILRRFSFVYVSSKEVAVEVNAAGIETVVMHDAIRIGGRNKNDFAPIEQAGNTLRIGHIKERSYSKNVSISFELEVPADTRVKGSTGSGNLSVEGVNGPVDASTGSGDVTATNIEGHVKADTGSGNVTLHAIKGGADADTGSGDVRASQVAGPFKADTGSGSIRLEQAAPGDVEVDTGSGDVDVQGVRGALKADTGSGRITAGGEVSGQWKLSAGSGDVDIQLASNAAFDLYAHTDSGNVKSDHPVTATGTFTPKEIQGKVRGGGPLLEVKTGSGNIHIR